MVSSLTLFFEFSFFHWFVHFRIDDEDNDEDNERLKSSLLLFPDPFPELINVGQIHFKANIIPKF